MAIGVKFEVRKQTLIPPDLYTWYDCTADVIRSAGVTWRRGIFAFSPADRVASAGSLTLTVERDSHVSAIGAYRARLNAMVRLRLTINDGASWITVFIGRIREIRPGAGPFRAGGKVRLTATDWMDDAAEMPLKAITGQVNKRSDEILTTLVAAASPAPVSTNFDTGDGLFPYALDDVQDGQSRMLQALAKVVQSERGWIYVQGDGTLRFEKRTSRASGRGYGAEFANNMTAWDETIRRGSYVNRATVTVHPRRVDAAATTILFKRFDIANGEDALAIPALSSVVVFGPYGDPNNGNARCGGTDMQTPSSGTDYTANTAADGTGTNVTSDLTVTPSFTANGVSATLANGNASAIYVTLLQFKGKGVYDTTPVKADDRRIDSDEEYTDVPIAVDMPYESDPNVGQSVASEIVTVYGYDTDRYLTYNALTQDRLENAVGVDLGARLLVRETANGVDGLYIVQSLSQELRSETDFVTTYGLVTGNASFYWVLGQANASELDSTTRLYF